MTEHLTLKDGELKPGANEICLECEGLGILHNYNSHRMHFWYFDEKRLSVLAAFKQQRDGKYEGNFFAEVSMDLTSVMLQSFIKGKSVFDGGECFDSLEEIESEVRRRLLLNKI